MIDITHLQGFLIANNNYYSDYTEIFFKKYLQLLYHILLFLLPVATTEAGHCWEYLVYICACCAYCSITKSVLHELDGLVCFQVLTCDILIQVVLLTLLFICLPLEQKIGIYLSRTFNFLTLLTRLYADIQSKNDKIAITSISGLLPIPSLRFKNRPIQHRMTDKQSMINDNITKSIIGL